MALLIKQSYEQEYGKEYVGMSKLLATRIIEEFSEYEDKKFVIRGIQHTKSPPYLSVPPTAWLKYQEHMRKTK